MSQTSINVPTPRRVDLEQDTLSITTTDADLSPIYASLTTNLGLIGDNTNSITSLRNDLTSNVASITANQGSITQVATDLSNNVLSISSLTGSISTINGSLSAHQASLSSHALSLSAHETAINNLDTNLGDVTASVINNAINIGSLSTSCSALSSDLGDVTSSVISNTLKIGSLTNAVALNTGSITTLTDRLNTISYTDINGYIPNEDVAEKGLTADKIEYDTTGHLVVGPTSYPTDTIGYELDYQNSNWWSIITSAYTAASMASAFNTLIGDPAEITSIAGIVAEQAIQNQRLFELDAPVSGRVAINEDNISTLSSSVGLLQGKTTDLSHNGTISTISGDLSITGSIVNSEFTYVEDSVGVLQVKTTEISYDDVNTITSITNNVYVGNDITIDGSITNTRFQAIDTRTTDLGYNNLTTTIFNTLSADNIINPELQSASTDIDNLETKTQNITSDGVNQTTITGQLEAGEVTCDTLAFGDPPTFLSELKTKLTDISFAALTTTIANTLSVGTIINAELQNATTDIDDLETKTQNITSSGANQTTISGTLSAGMFRANNGNLNPSEYLGTISADATFGGFIYTKAIVNEAENGLSPAAITFGDGPTLTSDKISLITNGAKRIFIDNTKVQLYNALTATSGNFTGDLTSGALSATTGNFTGTLSAGISTLATGSIITGGNGSSRLFIKADANNSGENNNPKIIFVQDGPLYEGSIGLGNNDLQIRSAVSSLGGISFWVGSTDTSGSEDALNAASQVGKFTTAGLSVTGTITALAIGGSSLNVGLGAVTGGNFFAGGIINNGTYAAFNPALTPYMTGRVAVFGDTTLNYGGGTNGWQTSGRTAGLMLECLDSTEFAVHDAGTRVASLMYYSGNNVTIGRDMGGAGWGALAGLYSNAGYFQHYGGSKIVIQNAVNGGTSRGIYMWTSGDPNWVIYMGQQGAGRSAAGNTAIGGDGFTSHALRFRVYNNSGNGFIWENSSEQLLMSLRGSDGDLYVRGDLSVAKDTDTTHYLGRAYIGYAGIANCAFFGHLDYQNSTNFAIRQDQDGFVTLNSGAVYLYITIQGSVTNRIFRNTINNTTQFSIYGVPAAAYVSTLRITSDTSGYICRQTSSRETKMDIEDVWDSLVDNVIDNLRPVWFRYRPEIATAYEYQKDFSDVGLIAEEVFEVEPRLAHLDENKKPHDVAYDRIGVWCLAYIKRQKKQIAELEAKNQELEAKIDAILNRLDAEVQVA